MNKELATVLSSVVQVGRSRYLNFGTGSLHFRSGEGRDVHCKPRPFKKSVVEFGEEKILVEAVRQISVRRRHGAYFLDTEGAETFQLANCRSLRTLVESDVHARSGAQNPEANQWSGSGRLSISMPTLSPQNASMVSMSAWQPLHVTGFSKPRNMARSLRRAGMSAKQFSLPQVRHWMKTEKGRAFWASVDRASFLSIGRSFRGSGLINGRNRDRSDISGTQS